MSRNYKFHNPSGLYFISFATVNWVEVFTRMIYFDLMLECLDYCRQRKGMELYSYCIMPNHVHLIFRSAREKPAGLVRDLKSYSARILINAIKENPVESRREWLLQTFKCAAAKQRRGYTHVFWQSHNNPIEIWSTKVLQQKITYIHQNPVEAGLVMKPWEYKYSSARNFAEMDYVLEIDDVGFLG